MEENTSICFLQFSSLNNFLVFYFPANELNSRVFNHFLGIRRQLSVLESKKSLACKNNFNIDRYRRRKNGVLTGIFHPRDRKHGELSERKIAGWGDGGGGASDGMGWIKINSIVFTYIWGGKELFDQFFHRVEHQVIECQWWSWGHRESLLILLSRME